MNHPSAPRILLVNDVALAPMLREFHDLPVSMLTAGGGLAIAATQPVGQLT